MIFLLALPALAADPVDTTGIVPIPEGTVITIPSQPPFTVTGQSYLLPEFHYDTALFKAKKLAILEPAFDQCTELTGKWVSVTLDSLSACSAQFHTDEGLVSKLQVDLTTQETRAITAETKVQQVRSQRNVAWAITGGLVLGAIAVTAVSIGS